MDVQRFEWSSAMISRLIAIYESNTCLWNPLDEHYKDRNRREKSINAIANHFHTSPSEIKRKIHNLRNQFNQEVTKAVKYNRQELSGDLKSKWVHFESMKFIRNFTSDRSDNKIKPSNTETNNTITIIETEESSDSELLSDKTIKYEIVGNRLHNKSHESTHLVEEIVKSNENHQYEIHTASPKSYEIRSASPIRRTLDNHSNMEPKNSSMDQSNVIVFDPAEIDTHKKYTTMNIQNDDEFTIFGQFVANELKGLKSAKNQRKLKRLIQQDILNITAEEDE